MSEKDNYQDSIRKTTLYDSPDSECIHGLSPVSPGSLSSDGGIDVRTSLGLICDNLVCVPAGTSLSIPEITVSGESELFADVCGEEEILNGRSKKEWTEMAHTYCSERDAVRRFVQGLIDEKISAIQAKDRIGGVLVVHPSLKNSNALYQVTRFDRRGPVSDSQIENVEELVDVFERCQREIWVMK